MKVLVCGGRDFTNAEFLNKTLDGLHAIYHFTELIHGAARGADTLAGSWAWTNGIIPRPFPADWALGKGAGPIRNQVMLDDKPDLVVAFPTGGPGTQDMINRAKKAEVKVLEFTVIN